MFDSPFELCSVCGEYVLLDQTQRQCAREHGCGGAFRCPLAKYFTGIDFGAAAEATEHPSHRKRRPPVDSRA
jgi:hypothetical protein